VRGRDHLKVLARNLRQEEEETGEQIGHVGFPFMEGQIHGKAIRGPIALFAASLGRKKIEGRYGWVLDVNAQAPMLNMAMMRALETAGDIQLGDIGAKFDELIDKVRHGKHVTLDALFGIIASWAENLLGIGASSRVAGAGPILPLGGDYAPDSWPLHVANRMAFGKFPQADVDLAGDYRRLMGNQDDGGIIGDVLGIRRGDDAAGAMRKQAWRADPGEEPHDRNSDDINSVSARRLNTVCPSDTSQDMVILESKSSPVTVVRGPPGTGKSQLIVNMAADAMHAGKRVLVVCQKRAALEVVYSRLKGAGLAECAVLMGRESDDRRAVYRQMAEALDRASNGDAAATTPPGRDGAGIPASVRANGALDAAIRDIDATTSELAKVGDALYAPHRSGANAHELRSLARGGYTSKRIPAIDSLDLTWEELAPFAKRVGGLQEGCLKYGAESHPLYGMRGTRGATHLDVPALRGTLERLVEISGGALGEALRERHACGATAHDIYDLARGGHTGRRIPAIDSLDLTWEELAPFAKRVGGLQDGCLRYDGGGHPLHGRRSLADAPAGAKARLRKALSRLVSIPESATVCSSRGEQEEASRIIGFWGKKHPWWVHRRGAAKSLQALMGRQVDESDIGAEMRRIHDGLEWWEAFASLGEFFTAGKMGALKGAALPGGTTRVGSYGKAAWESMLGALDEYDDMAAHDRLMAGLPGQALKVLDGLRENAGAGESWQDIVTQEACRRWIADLNKTCPKLSDLASSGAVGEWLDSIDRVCGFFDEQAAARLRGHAASPDSGHARWNAMLRATGDIEQIQEHDRLKSESSPAVLGVVDSLRKEAGAGGDWGDIVMQEVCLRWVGELDAQAGVLRGDLSSRHNRLRARLADALKRQRVHVRDAIVAMAQESICLRPTGSRGPTGAEARWGEFAREVRKKRGRPVRVAFEQYADNFLAIAPCWLMSPAAACRVFPLQNGMFDLVIVDEASQITVEMALPVLYRGRRAVIVGDDRQLTPDDFFQAKHEDDSNDDGTVDPFGGESLFDMASAMRRPLLLSWHYRSRHQELIDFSNRAFYAGRLNVAPSVAIRPKDPPIRWVACNGEWANRGNAIEAHRSVDIVHEVWKAALSKKMPSIAIVTFNSVQRDAVQDEIQNRYENDGEFRHLHDRANSGKGAEDLIVRNIENVQGDERDVIVFSIGYARGADNTLKFSGGPLFTKGGENRLNVAITRARMSMVVVCSIEPTDISGSYANPGPKLLRQFLAYAKATSDQNEVAQKSVLNSLGGAISAAFDPREQAPEAGLEDSVARELERHGYEIHARVGKSEYSVDLAIVDRHDPTRYVLGIECDGEQFRNARSVRERDVLRQGFLESRGWAIERIWSTSWHRDRRREVERIRSRVEGIYKGRGLPAP